MRVNPSSDRFLLERDASVFRQVETLVISNSFVYCFSFLFFFGKYSHWNTHRRRERERDTGEKTPSCRRWGNNTLSAVVDDEKERVRRETSEEGAIVDDVNRRAGRRSSGSQVDARSSNINDWAVTAKQQRLCATLGSRTISFSGARTHTDTHTPHRRRRRRGLPSAHVDLSLSALCLRLFCLFRRRSLYSPRREKKLRKTAFTGRRTARPGDDRHISDGPNGR